MAICEKLLEVKDWKMYNSHTHICVCVCVYIYMYIYIYIHTIFHMISGILKELVVYLWAS